MARYFFHVHDSVSIRDRDGTELPGLADARREAIRLVGGLIADASHAIDLAEDWNMTVADEVCISAAML